MDMPVSARKMSFAWLAVISVFLFLIILSSLPMPVLAAAGATGQSAQEILESQNIDTGQQVNGSTAVPNQSAVPNTQTKEEAQRQAQINEGVENIKNSVVNSINDEDVQTGFNEGMTVVDKAWQEIKNIWHTYVRPYADKYPLIFIAVIVIFIITRLPFRR